MTDTSRRHTFTLAVLSPISQVKREARAAPYSPASRSRSEVETPMEFPGTDLPDRACRDPLGEAHLRLSAQDRAAPQCHPVPRLMDPGSIRRRLPLDSRRCDADFGVRMLRPMRLRHLLEFLVIWRVRSRASASCAAWGKGWPRVSRVWVISWRARAASASAVVLRSSRR